METEFRFKGFISYSHSDEEWAKWLHRARETYLVPTHPVGRETEFGPVPARAAAVRLPDRHLLAVGSALALDQGGILAFKRLGREHRILALVVDGELTGQH